MKIKKRLLYIKNIKIEIETNKENILSFMMSSQQHENILSKFAGKKTYKLVEIEEWVKNHENKL